MLPLFDARRLGLYAMKCLQQRRLVIVAIFFFLRCDDRRRDLASIVSVIKTRIDNTQHA